MTNSSDGPDRGIADEQLPEDLRPDENPLARGLEERETAGDLLEEGKHAEQDSDQDQGEDQDEDREADEEADQEADEKSERDDQSG